MNSMVRQDPWSLMPCLQDEINRLFGSVQQTDSSSSATATWVPAVDIHEYTDRFELYVDVLRRLRLPRRGARAVAARSATLRTGSCVASTPHWVGFTCPTRG